MKTRGALLIGFLFSGGFLQAALLSSEDAAAVQKRFRENQRSAKTLQMDFVSTLRLERLEKEISSKGVLYYQAPDRVRMTYTEPAGEWVVLNGKRLALQKKNRPLQTFDLARQPRAQEGIQALLGLVGQGVESWDSTHETKILKEGGKFRVELRPKAERNERQPGRVEVVLRTDFSIEAIQIEFGNGNGMSYQLEAPEWDRPLDAALFQIPEAQPNPAERLKSK